MKRTIHRWLTSYELIAFVTGFALMAFELAASRMLAPTIGSSTYVWTSVIGVIIMALSLGYALGGVIADKRVTPSDITWLLLATACAVVITPLLAQGLLEFISNALQDPRLQGLTASLLLFMPASFLLGIISPYLARLRTESLTTTGTSVAGLSAANAIGGIIGTFCVGFIFFGYIGVRETVLSISVLLVVASWLLLPHYRFKERLVISALVIGAIFAQLWPTPQHDSVVTIDTPSAHYQVINTTYGNEQVRLLTMGPLGAQSGLLIDQPQHLIFWYTIMLANLIDRVPQKQDILVLGGGSFTLPRYLADTYKQSHIDVVEIDPKLLDIAEQHFFYSDRPNVSVIANDARAYLHTNKKPYDIIIVDVYSDISIPFSLATKEYTKELQASLKSHGVVLANIIGSANEACKPMLASLHATYRATFKHHIAYAQADENLQARQNIIAGYSNQPQAWWHNAGLQAAMPTAGRVLTDNFAPFERMEQQCAVGMSS